MVSTRRAYSENWEQFIRKINHYSPNQRRALLAEVDVDSKLAMIHALAREWVSRNNDPIQRLQARQARILEERRMTPNPSARRNYLSGDDRAMLPPIAVKRIFAADREQNRAAATRFWRGLAAGSWRGRSVAQIVARSQEVPARAWLLAHPYGPPVSLAELDELARVHRSLRPVARRRAAQFNPAGMTPERALQIAMAVQEGRGA